MGCVLSPDKAKLLLNTVLIATVAVGRGVRMWGFSSSDVHTTMRRISSLAFADDYLGCFESETELRKVWRVWRLWEVISGTFRSTANMHNASRNAILKTLRDAIHIQKQRIDPLKVKRFDLRYVL